MRDRARGVGQQKTPGKLPLPGGHVEILSFDLELVRNGQTIQTRFEDKDVGKVT